MSEQKQELKQTSFDLKVHSSNELKQVFGAISSLVEEATFEITNEGLTFQGMDPSHVCLIDLTMSNVSFEKYEVQQEGKFAVRIDEINKLMKNFNKKDSLRIYTKDLVLTFETKTTKTQLRMIDASSCNCPVPKLRYNAKVGITTDAIKKALNQIKTVSDYVTLDTTNIRNFILSGKGDSGESTIIFERGMEEIPEIEVREESKTVYSLEYLIPFLRQLKTCKYVTLEYSSRQPLRVEAKIDNMSKMFFYLAPRIEN